MESSSDESENESSSDEDAPAAKKASASPAKKTVQKPATEKKDETSEESESEEKSDDEPQKQKTKTQVEAAAVVPTPTKALKKRKRKAEEAIEKQVVSTNKQKVVKKMTRPSEEELSKAATKVVSSSEDESDEEEEKPAKTPKTDNDVIRTEVAKTSTPKTPSTQQSGGSKTLFMGNLSYFVEKAEVKNFFGSTGEVVDIQRGISMDGNSFRNYAYVEFATSEEAEKAMELNGEMLMGRQIKLKFPRESSSLQGEQHLSLDLTQWMVKKR